MAGEVSASPLRRPADGSVAASAVVVASVRVTAEASAAVVSAASVDGCGEAVAAGTPATAAAAAARTQSANRQAGLISVNARHKMDPKDFQKENSGQSLPAFLWRLQCSGIILAQALDDDVRDKSRPWGETQLK